MRNYFTFLFSIKRQIVYVLCFILLIIIIIGIVKCNKENSKAMDDVIDRIDNKVCITNKVESVESQVSNRYIEYQRDNGEYYKVYFHLFYNDNHKNGYVIIESINVNDMVYRILEKNEKRYIDNVNTKDYIQAFFSVADVNTQGEEYLDSIFRTAEAIVMTFWKTENTKVNENDVYKSGQQMIGRKCGLQK